MSWFGSKKAEDPKEAQKGLRGAKRDLDKEVRRLDQAQAKCEEQIRAYARDGNQAGLRIMAKELVSLRKQKERIQTQSVMMNSLQSKVAVSQSVGTMATAMGSAATIMAKQNAALTASDVPAAMRKFAMASEGMAMTEEMMDDMLADAFGEDEGAADDIISETFAELGLGISSALPAIPRSAVEAPAGAAAIRAPAPASRTAVPAGMSSEDAAVAAVLREVLGAK